MQAQGQIELKLTLVPTAPLPGILEDESSTQQLIDGYLRCADLPSSETEPIRFESDDVSLMRVARQIATGLRERNEVFASSPLGRVTHRQRVMGGVFAHLIQSFAGAILSPQIRQHEEVLGIFFDIVIEIVCRRIQGTASFALEDSLQASNWPSELKAGVLACVEKLWNVAEMTGLSNSACDPNCVRPVIVSMASYYTLVYFAQINPRRVDVLYLDDALTRLSSFTSRLVH